LGVTVLERQTSYRDKVRGEVLQPWGVAEAIQLGLEDTLLAGGGCWVTQMASYDELIPPATAPVLQVKRLRADVPGAMDLGHPQTCAALADGAASHGAVVHRGVGDVPVTAGSIPRVRFELDDVEHDVDCRLVVAADGRASSVRRQIGLTLYQTRPRTWGSGMLVDGLDQWPSHLAAFGTEGDLHFYVFRRDNGVARLYLMSAFVDQHRFRGWTESVSSSMRSGSSVSRTATVSPAAFPPVRWRRTL
jgi:2-polyprenyl-6-methoxyphenol hydroxylase-like FAD-dependent oxidoreductase